MDLDQVRYLVMNIYHHPRCLIQQSAGAEEYSPGHVYSHLGLNHTAGQGITTQSRSSGGGDCKGVQMGFGVFGDLFVFFFSFIFLVFCNFVFFAMV